ncbi:MAG: 5-(carboxyamino)imidazole ribonucleotide synthase [Hyphomicrobiaceae bacterium]|nr:5-(carboxyamino)imidazole ribonucleotide synthase [Hyphomicrobiaceae bacterium]
MATHVPPGSTIGILGSGQLGRMLALAAARLGLRCHIYADTPGPASDCASAHTIAPYDDEVALAAFADAVSVATFEFENIPVATVEFLAKRISVRPGAKALGVTQDRLAEKRLARDLGAETAEFASVDGLAELETRCREIGLPAVLKTRRLGYDGRGQAKLSDATAAKAAWQAIGQAPAILERFVPFQSEASVIGVRGVDGSFAAYDVVNNDHRDHILHTSTVPAHLSATAAEEAIATTRAIADALDYVGVLAVEFFVLDDARQDLLYVNEIAPRVHNSGHWTIDACTVSQFENHMRAVAGWPIGSTARHSDAVMTNLIGREHVTYLQLAAEPGACVHLYGKNEARNGRKMGHVTRIKPRPG